MKHLRAAPPIRSRHEGAGRDGAASGASYIGAGTSTVGWTMGYWIAPRACAANGISAGEIRAKEKEALHGPPRSAGRFANSKVVVFGKVEFSL